MTATSPLTLGRALTAWSVDLPVLALVLGSLTAYVVGATHHLNTYETTTRVRPIQIVKTVDKETPK